jgi:hypothetical protein
MREGTIMNDFFIQLAGVLVAVISCGIAVFQILLFLGYPLAEYSWGGKYEGVLPRKLRMMSLFSALVLLLFGFILLIHTQILHIAFQIPTHIFVLIITIFMGLNTLGNLASKSKKEKFVMTPLAGLTFLSCLYVLINS